MRDIRRIVIHCSATKEGVHHDIKKIRSDHLDRGFYEVGYHLVIYLDGRVVVGRPMEKAGAHAKGYNYDSIGVCYIGGLDYKGKPKDTRTQSQVQALRNVVTTLQATHPKAEVVGHRDLSVDLNGDGAISRDEWMKACPCFDMSEL